MGYLESYTARFDPEAEVILRFLNEHVGPPGEGRRVLDLGCGYGRMLRRLLTAGYDVIGVDSNTAIVRANRDAGLPCMGPEDLEREESVYEAILISHVIEHFPPRELLTFLDHALNHLRRNGHLLLATPLEGPHFFDDFDHVKPYHPEGIMVVFGDAPQMQYASRHRLQLQDLWYRRRPMRLPQLRATHLPTAFHRPVRAFELASAVLFEASGGRLGPKDGWVGVFRKTT